MISNTLNSGLDGIRNGTLGMQDAATRIARAGTTDGSRAAEGAQQPAGQAAGGRSNDSLVQAMVDLKVNQRGVESSVQVVKAADEMLGTLIDERA